jgi:hypothetical protein
MVKRKRAARETGKIYKREDTGVEAGDSRKFLQFICTVCKQDRALPPPVQLINDLQKLADPFGFVVSTSYLLDAPAPPDNKQRSRGSRRSTLASMATTESLPLEPVYEIPNELGTGAGSVTEAAVDENDSAVNEKMDEQEGSGFELDIATHRRVCRFLAASLEDFVVQEAR